MGSRETGMIFFSDRFPSYEYITWSSEDLESAAEDMPMRDNIIKQDMAVRKKVFFT